MRLTTAFAASTGALCVFYAWTIHGATNEEFNAFSPMYRQEPRLTQSDPGFLGRLTRDSESRIEMRVGDSINMWNSVYSSDYLPSGDSGPLSRSIVTSAFEDSAKEVALDSPLLDDTKEYFLGKFLRGSIGNTEEEHLTLGGQNMQYQEQSWWKRVRQEGSLQYGVRPFQTSPYAYVSGRVRKYGEDLLFVHLRYHYQSLQAHKVEALLALPLDHGMQLETGIVYLSSGVELRATEQKYAWTAKLEKVMRRKPFELAAYCGAELNDRTAIVAGMIAAF